MANYSVSLVIGSEVHNPQAAVDSYIEALLTNGLRSWVYIVTNDEDDTVIYSDGWGNLMDEEGMKRYVAGLTSRPAPPRLVTPEEDVDPFVDDEEGVVEDEEVDQGNLAELLAKYTEQQQRTMVTVPAAVLNAAMEQVSED